MSLKSKSITYIFGANGGIGHALVKFIAKSEENTTIYAVSRKGPENYVRLQNVHEFAMDYSSPAALAAHLSNVEVTSINRIIVASGVLSAVKTGPEKSLLALSTDELIENYRINTIIPAIIFKYFHKLLAVSDSPVFAALSARLGSISDNKLGGWYSYRMSKAALNMFIKTASIEFSRIAKRGVVIGLHPGTVNTPFSERYLKNREAFTPEEAAQNLATVLKNLTPDDSGKCFAYDARVIDP